ncbi:MAG: response regulator [Armatimonadetes bacterium]|nr:response regulator [Armatimonadota bacterium]
MVEEANAAGGTGHRVLVVDDEGAVRRITARRLTSLGCTVVQACDGQEALASLLADGPFDLILTDHAMPGMTGLELAAQLRSRQPGVAIILTTGMSADLDQATLVGQPISDVLLKPYTTNELYAAVRRLL